MSECKHKKDSQDIYLVNSVSIDRLDYSIINILADFYEKMKLLENDDFVYDKQASMVAVTSNDIIKLFKKETQ